MNRFDEALTRLGLDPTALWSADIQEVRLFATEACLRLLRIQRVMGLPSHMREPELAEEQWEHLHRDAIVADLIAEGTDPDLAARFADAVAPEMLAEVDAEIDHITRGETED